MATDFLGFGLTRPFRRDKKADFASAGGAELIKSSLGQILGTKSSNDFFQGELPWRPEFGSLIHTLRHQKNDAVLQDLGRIYVLDAVQRWEPRVIIRTVETRRQELGSNRMTIRVLFDLIDENVPGNNVLIEGLEVIVAV